MRHPRPAAPPVTSISTPEEIKPPATPQTLTEQHFSIQYGDTGYTYDTIFGSYLAGAKMVTIEDPYIRAPHQIGNFVRFYETALTTIGCLASSLRANSAKEPSICISIRPAGPVVIDTAGGKFRSLTARPLHERKARLAALLSNVGPPLDYTDHQTGHGQVFHENACAMALEGIVSKRADAPYAPGNRGLWVKGQIGRDH